MRVMFMMVCVRAVAAVVVCLTPSLPSGYLDVVVAGYEYLDYGEHHYLWDMGLTNVQFWVYRRVEELLPLREWRGACGVVVRERMLLPNRGAEASAFVQYALEFRSNLPRVAVVFLHGHMAKSWHITCESVFDRVALYYNEAATKPRSSKLLRHMMSLTSPAPHAHFFERRNPRAAYTERMVCENQVVEPPCIQLLRKYSVNYEHIFRPGNYNSCCASFILPSRRIRKYPSSLYADLLRYFISFGGNCAAKVCFEGIVYGLYQDPPFVDSSYLAWYNITGRYEQAQMARCLSS